jgi:hypothetical protein
MLMMLKILSVIILSTIHCLSVCALPVHLVKNGPSTDTTIIIRSTQGCWTTDGLRKGPECGGSGLAMEQSIGFLFESVNWYFDADTVYQYRYPCEYYYKDAFRIQSDSIYLGDSKQPYAHIKIDRDKLLLTFQGCISMSFDRDTFDKATLEMLKRDTINPECLLGKMSIVTHFEPDDDAPFDVIPPVNMPKHINIDHKLFASIRKTKSIELLIDGKKRRFYVVGLRADKFKPSILLEPAEWWEEDIFMVTYEGK